MSTSILGVGPPSAWGWATLHALVLQRGHWRINGLPVRHVADAAEIAGQHGLSLVRVGPGVHELRLMTSGARIGAAVGPRRIAR